MIINIIMFLLTLLIVEIYYRVFILRKDMKYDPNKVPTEVALLIKKYNLDMKRVNYYYLMKSIGRINALTLAVIMFIVTFFKRINIQILIAILLCIPGILISYSLLGKALVKQNLTVDSTKSKKANKKKSTNKTKKETKNKVKKKGNDK